MKQTTAQEILANYHNGYARLDMETALLLREVERGDKRMRRFTVAR